jgi:PPOX class probable F420-dependent enzyme
MHPAAGDHPIETTETPPGARIALILPGKYICLTSFKRDGTGVPTPVWFVTDQGRVLVLTASQSFKVKRIVRNPDVTVASCSASGRLRSEPVLARAELLPENELHRVEQLMNRKYRADRILILPIYRMVQRLRGVHGAPSDAVLAITPTGQRVQQP